MNKLLKPLLALAIASAVLAASPAWASSKGDGSAKGRQPKVRVIELSVTEHGYEPSPLTVKSGEPVKLVVTRKTAKTCATELVLDEHQINKPLPLNEPVEITFTPKKSGTLKYGCAMGKMIAGVIKVE